MMDCPELPGELLDEIGKRLTYPDHVRFCAVSMQWRRLISKRPKLPVSHIPWLLLPPGNDSSSSLDDDHCTIYTLADGKVYEFELPKAAATGNTLFRGSSTNGWLFVVDDGLALKLVNPLTRKHIDLPSIPALPEVIEYVADREKEYVIQGFNDQSDTYYEKWKLVHSYYIRKWVMSPNHTSRLNKEEEHTMVVIYGLLGRLAFYKHGDTLWTAAQIKLTGLAFDDALFHEGIFYAVTAQGFLYGSYTHMLPKVGVIEVDPPEGLGTVGNKLCLVGTSSGLLMLERCYAKCFIIDRLDLDPTFETTKFNIYELNIRAPPLRWKKVESLGHDKTLFVGNSTSLVATTSQDFPELKGNCIYFTNDQRYYYTEGPEGFDIGVFDLDDGTIKKLPGYNDRRSKNLLVLPPPIWVMPSSC